METPSSERINCFLDILEKEREINNKIDRTDDKIVSILHKIDDTKMYEKKTQDRDTMISDLESYVQALKRDRENLKEDRERIETRMRRYLWRLFEKGMVGL